MSIILEPGQTTINIEMDKDAKKAFRFDLSAYLSADDPLTSVTWAPPTGVIISDDTNDGTDAVGWFEIDGVDPKSWLSCVATWTTAAGARDQFVVQIYVKEDAELSEQLGSALFPNKFSTINEMRRDRLVLAAQHNFGGTELSSDYIWSKLIAAEAEVARTLRVKLQPTAFFPTTPTQDQIDALDGMPWEEDPAYDYDPEMFQGEMWGFIVTNHKPIISVQSLEYVYPAPAQLSYEIPSDWLRMDKKAGQVRIVPSTIASVPVSGYLLQIMGGSRLIPHMMQLTYVAGLANAVRDFPDLVDVVKKLAVLKIIEDSYLPQSGSISADGLSQSMSVDMSKYQDSIDRTLNGPKGANGGLMAAIHGVRLGVM